MGIHQKDSYIEDCSNTIEVTIMRDIYKTSIKVDKDTGESYEDYKIIKRNVRSKKVIFKDDIRSIEEEITTKGTVYKNKTILTVSGLQDPLIVIGNYNKLKQEILNNPNKRNQIGFKFY